MTTRDNTTGKGGSVRTMLDAIEQLPAREQAARLCWLISRINIDKGHPGKKIATADLIIERAIDICRLQGQRYLGVNLPLSKEDRDAVQHLFKAMNFLDQFYHTALALLSDRNRDRTQDDRKFVGRCLVGKAIAAHEVLLLCAATHMNWPTGLWLSLHKTWRQARRLEMHEFETSIMSQPMTLESIYRVSLLVGLSDLYRLPFRSIYATYELIIQLEQSSKVVELKPDSKDRTLFLLQLKDDSPGIPLHNVDFSNMTGHRYVLDVTKLVAAIDGKDFEVASADQLARTVEYQSNEDRDRALYSHLRLNLGVRPTRGNTRIPDTTRYHFYTGFDPVRALIGKRRALEKGLDDVPLDEQNDNISCPGIAISVDRSTTGLKLSLEESASFRIRAGDIIAMTDENDDSFFVGLIRWVRGGGVATLEFGVERIKGVPATASLSVLDGTSPSLDFDVVPCVAVVDDLANPTAARVLSNRNLSEKQNLRLLWINELSRIIEDRRDGSGSDLIYCVDASLMAATASRTNMKIV